MLNRRQTLAGGAALLASPVSGAETPLFDTHTHIYTGDLARYPIVGDVTDVIRERVRERPVTAETLLKLWDEQGVEGGVWVQYNGAYKTDNRYLFDSADAHKARAAPVMVMDLTDPNTPAVLRQAVKAHGVTGVRALGAVDDKGELPWFASDAAQPAWAEAGKLGVAVELLYTPRDPTASALGKIAEMAKRYPRQVIVVDHMGWAGHQPGPEFGLIPASLALAPLRNVHFKLSSITYSYLTEAKADKAAFVKRMVGLYGADRIMWGSDYGNTQVAYPQMVAWAREGASGLSAADRRKVLHDTGKRVLGRKKA